MKLMGWPSGILDRKLHYAPSALPVSALRVPGALPQAVTFRAFGALNQSFAELSASAGVLVSDCWPIAIDCRVCQQRVPQHQAIARPLSLIPNAYEFLKEIRP